MPEIEISHNLELEFPNDIKEIALRQGEDPDKTCELTQELRDMIYERGECTPHRMDDEFLVRFLRARFWKVENAYKLMCRYYDFKEDNPQFFTNVHPNNLQSMGEHGIIHVLPYRDQNGRRIMIHRIGNWKPNKVSMDDIFKATLVLLEIGSMEPRAQILGGVGIFDMEGFGLGQAWHMSPSIAQKIIAIMVTSMPMRTNAIHIVNESWTFDAMFQMFKPFLNERMRERIFFHGHNYKSLHQHISRECLPTRYGGLREEYSHEPWLESIRKNPVVSKELESLGYIMDDEDSLEE